MGGAGDGGVPARVAEGIDSDGDSPRDGDEVDVCQQNDDHLPAPTRHGTGRKGGGGVGGMHLDSDVEHKLIEIAVGGDVLRALADSIRRAEHAALRRVLRTSWEGHVGIGRVDDAQLRKEGKSGGEEGG